MKRAAILAGLLALLLVAFWFKGALVEPGAVPERVAAGEFDTKRAMARLGRILGDQRPHAVDSAENDAVRDRLIAELRGLGLSPTVTDDFTCNAWAKSPSISCARIRNVLATVGPATGRPVMMVSHYDSTLVGPGAGDDGIGMAVMLETAALLKQRALTRPVLLLFNEGEEAGLIGARAFMERNPMAAQVDAVVNLEARGVTGPAVMFETSRPNGAAIAAYARSAERPSGNSMTADFYAMIPNDTDVSVLKERPYTILNLAIIGNETRYHSPGDDMAALDPRSVRHMGEQALAATAQLAMNGVPAARGDRLYTDLLGEQLVAIPKAVGLVLLAGLLALFAWLAWRRGGLALSLAIAVVALVDAALLAFLGQWMVKLFRGGEWWRAHPEVTGLAVYLSALAASLCPLLLLGRGLARDRLRIGFWLLFLILGCILAFVAPGGAIFFLLPPLVLGAAMLARRWERPAALAGWTLLFLGWAPLLHSSEVLLDMDSAWTFAPIAALIMLPMLIELKPLLAPLPRHSAFVAFAAVAIAGWVIAGLAPAYSEDRKQAFGIEYAWEQAESRSRWAVVNDGAALPATYRGFEADVEVRWSGRRRWAAPAPRQPVEAPRVETLAEQRVEGGRRLRLRLSARGAESLVLRAKPEAKLAGVEIGGRLSRFAESKGDYFFRCHGRNCDGLELTLVTRSAQPFELELIGTRRGLPQAARPLLDARPAHSAPQYTPDSTIAVDRVKL